MTKKLLTIALSLLFLPVAIWAQFGATPNLKVSGRNLVDPKGNKVVLHGVMETPNAYFNQGRWTNGITWADYNNEQNIGKCLSYFTNVFNAVANPAKGTYCNLFRLHLDPCWLQDNNIKAAGFTENGGKVYDPHGSEVSGEASIYHFSQNKLRRYLQDLYIPIVKDALAHGLYVIIRPPGVFPHEIVVGDYYNNYLLTVWDIVSNDPYIKANSGKISLELGNEPVHIWDAGTTNFTQSYYAYDWNRSTLADFFQPIVNKIRSNGFDGIIWLPGTGYQAEYRSYTHKMVSDSKNNIAFAAHFYPGWYDTTANDEACKKTNAQVLSTFKTQIPVQADYPIVITEVDWSPKDGTSGHYDEHGSWVTSNFGTWGTGSTSEKSKFGEQYKYVVDQCGNISWTIEGSDLYVDMDAYLRNGTVQPAFLDKMKAAGYADAYQACSGSCFQWFQKYATVNIPTQQYTTTATTEGNAMFDQDNNRYIFYTAWFSAFIFKEFDGMELLKCADFTIKLSDNTTGYRLDVQLKDKDGNIIKDGNNNYIIGTEAKGTRTTDIAEAKEKVYNMQEIFADYIAQYPGCTIGEIRLNTVVPSEDTNKAGLYYLQLEKMEMNLSQVVAKAAKHVDLADVPLYDEDTQKDVTATSIRLNTDVTNGAEIFGAGLLGNVSYKQYSDLSRYSKMVIKGTGGVLRVLYNRQQTGTCPELNVSLENGEAVIDMTPYEQFRLNSIKVSWGNTVNVESITLFDSSDPTTFADYYISGAGSHDASVGQALADEKATVIDLQGFTGKWEDTFASINPNCVLIWNKDNKVVIAGGLSIKNNAWGYDTWAANLVEGYDFRTPVPFTCVKENGATYTRNLTSEWATIALPFNLDVDNTTAEIYQLGVVGDDDKMTFRKVTSGTLAAGNVVMYRNAMLGETQLVGNNMAKTVEGFNVQPAGIDGWYTAQSFTHKVINDVTKDPVLKDYEVYAISENKFVHATKKLTLKPFRALYLTHKGSSAAKKSFSIFVEDEDASTGVVVTTTTEAPGIVERYDAMGRRLAAPTQGINILRMSDGTMRKVK